MSPLELIAVLVWSFAVSFFGGLVGLVLGNLRPPLIVLVASSPAAGAGTNVAISGAAAYLGSHSTGRLDEHQLIRAMAVVLVISGVAMAVQAIVG